MDTRPQEAPAASAAHTSAVANASPANVEPQADASLVALAGVVLGPFDTNSPASAPPSSDSAAAAAASNLANDTEPENDTPTQTSTPTSSKPIPAAAPRRRGHRAQSSVWRLLTDDADPHKTTNSVCRHCATSVPHHHKSEKARAHLKRCMAFRAAMSRVDASQWPEWMVGPSAPARSPPKRDADENQLDSLASAAKRVRSSARPVNLSEVEDAVAMFIYSTGSPFDHMEDPHLRRAFAACLPPPLALRVTTQDLHGAVLDRAFATVQCDLLRIIQRPNAVNVVCVNSWFAPRELRRSVGVAADACVYTVGTARTPLFVDAAAAETSDRLQISMYDNIARALSLCGDNVHGIVSDNSHAAQLMWAKFKAIFPAKFFHGCASHGLFLFVDQIFSRAAGDVSVFAELQQLVEHCRELVAFFSSTAAAPWQAQLASKLADAGLETLEMPLPGQWLRLKAGLESVLVVLPGLLEITALEGFATSSALSEEEQKLRTRVATIVQQPELETLLFKAVALVDPLDSLLRRIEQDPEIPISDVFYWFAKELPVALSRVPGLTADESPYLLKLNQNRFNAMYGDSHGMAYLLDPRYVGEGLSPDVRKNIEDLIFQTPCCDTGNDDGNSEEYKVGIAQQLTEFVIDATQEKATSSFRYSMLAKNKKTVLQYWLSDGLRWPLLQRLAVRLFSLPASTLPMTKHVLRVPLRLPTEELPEATRKKLAFIQLNQVLLQSFAAEDTSATSQ